MNGAQALFKALVDGGLDTCFGNPGTSEMQLVYEMGLARVREGDANDKMLSMINLNNPTLDWTKIAQGQGVPASRATTAEEFHKQFEAAIKAKGPHLIEAQIVEDIKPMIEYIRKSMNME
jgi:thiamine pyrophosphate-dependent acetolactate synthase large subunit-like protein